MKITLIREERESGKEAVSTQETDMLMEKLKTENKTGYITELRSIIPHLKGTNARYEHIDRLPRLYPAVEMTRTKAGEHRIKTYNGLILLEVNNLAGVAEAELVKQQAALLPQTFAAFCGSSGRSAKIWVRFTLPDGGLPKNEDDIALFHAHAYRLAVKCYQPLLPFPITLQAPSLLQSCRMTVDEQPYYSPTAVAFCLEQPCALPSDYVPLYNPIEEYLYNTGRWDGKDRIRALADLVPCHNPHWRELFYRWFLGMVAHWRGIDKQHGNNTSPLLVGSQGYRKSTFCRILLPPELRFGYTDSIDFKSKQEAERSLDRFFLINIDEFDQINANQQGFLKHLLQKPVANLRKPYGSTIQEMRRYASFIGTSNLKDLLTDPSGSRRFICIEVTGPIQTNVTINYHQLYAQAMHDIMKGERYWLDDTDEAIVKEYNREFERVDPLEELFLCHFRGAEESEEGEWLTAMQIFNDLQQKTRDKLAINRIAAFGRTLRKLDILNKKSNRGTLYHLVRIEE